MSETKPPSAAAEKMAKELKGTLVQRRPRPWRAVLITLAICTLLLAALSWWFYPGPKLEPLQIVAMDEICSPDEKLSVRAQLYVVVPEETPRRMGGHTIVFLEPPPLLQPAGKTLEVIRTSDDQGQASSDWPVPKSPFAEFRVRHIDIAKGAQSIDHARVFVCAKDAPLFLVDVDETLKADALDADAAKTLARAAEEGWQIGYLSVVGDKAVDYRKTRDWTIAQAKLPRGPVLGRAEFAGTQASEGARRELLKSLRTRFTGNIVAIVKSADAALASKEAGLPTFQLGAEPIAGVVGVASWVDVPVRLKK